MSLALAIALMMLVSSSLVIISPKAAAIDLDWQIMTVDMQGGSETSLALDAHGNVHIAYSYDDGSEGIFEPDLKYANNTNGNWVNQTVDSAGSVGWGCSMALDAQGYAHISYWTYTTRDLKYATNKDGFWNITTVDAGAVDQYTSIAVDHLGFAHISYQRDDHLWYANNTGGSWNAHLVDSTIKSGEHSSIDIDSLGYAHISYYSIIGGTYVPGYLYYANNIGGSWSTQTLDSVTPVRVGEFQSLSLDDDDHVHIAYSWHNNSEYNQVLKYINNTYGAWTNQVVDDSFNPSTGYLSLDIDANGRAHISYIQAGELFYATNYDGSWSRDLVRTDVDYQNSIKVGADGLVHISFRPRFGSEYLMYATTSLVQDVQDPTVGITGPTSDATYSTTSNSISLSGTASDNFGVVSVNWTNAATDGSGTASGLTSWNIFNMDLAVGDNLITVFANDSAGNSGTDSITVTYVVDSTDPTVTITSPSSADTYSTDTSNINVGGTSSDDFGVTAVYWSNSEAGGSGTCSGTTSWGVSNIPLVLGDNHITIAAQDAAGNTGSDVIIVNYYVDTTDPVVDITTPSDVGSYTSYADHVALGGTASDNIAVASVTWSNDDTSGSGSCSGTTSWGVSNIPLVLGDNHITVTAQDAAGNTGTDVITVTYVLDITDPTVAITAPSSSATYTAYSSQVTLSGSASDDSGVTSVTWSNAATGNSGTCTGTTSWSVSGVALVQGANQITVTAHDASGNTGTDVITVTYVLDATDPTVDITAPSSSGSFTTETNSVSLGGTASDNVGVTSVTWSNAGTGNSGSCTGTTSWSVSSVSLMPGANVITVTAHDATGNQASDSITVTYNVPDTTDPSGSITFPTNGSVHYTNETSVEITGTAADNKGVAQVNWSNTATGASGDCVGTTSWSASIDLQAGENVIVVRIYDAAGNNLELELTVIVDQEGPEVALFQPSGATTMFTNSTSIDLGGSASDDRLLGSVNWRNAANDENGTCVGTSNWTAADIPLEEGENEITITVRDAAGNEETFTLLVMVDSISPALAITSPSGGELTTNATSVLLAGSVSDAGEVVSVNWTNSRGGSGTATVSEGNWSVNGITLSEGANLIRVTARDAFNNTASVTITVTFEPDGVDEPEDDGQWLLILIAVLIAILVALTLLIMWRRSKKG